MQNSNSENQTIMRCKNCGWPNKPNQAICAKCGTPLTMDEHSAESYGESLTSRAGEKVNETIAAIRAALIDKDVKEENINTDFINIYPLYDYSGDQEQLSAYNASSTLAIKVTDMESVGALIDVCFAAGANTLNGISFSASDTEEAKTEAMKKAVADAKNKAEILAEASGLKITRIENITEGGVYSYQNNIGNVYARGMDDVVEEADDTGTVVQSAKLIVSASVSITFEAE